MVLGSLLCSFSDIFDYSVRSKRLLFERIMIKNFELQCKYLFQDMQSV